MIKIKSDKIILLDSIFNGFIYLDNGKIVEVSKTDRDCLESYDFTSKYVSPGFIEMHTHGGGGYPFINNTVNDVVNACNFHLKYGTTSICPTITAGPFEVMKKATINVVEAIKTGEIKSNVIGVHLEGPYLSKEQCGAQCPTFITSPNENDYIPFLNEYGKYISKWTYAPENDKDQKFVKTLVKNNIIASIGHSNAIYDDVKKAVECGANMVTHLYSCTSSITRDHGFRRLGVTECAYLFDELNCEIIADGRHLPLELIKLILKDKGTDKVVLVSDSLEIAGTSIKEGTMSGTDFVVEDGVCKLKDRSAFAGSIATDEKLIKTIVEAGYPIYDAVKMMSYNPANLLKLNKGIIKEGLDADIIVFDENYNVFDVFVAGKKCDL